MSKVTGRLEDWYRSQPASYEDEFMIWGDCYDDIHKRFPDGMVIHTSGIKNREVKEGDVVKTRNSTYLLGKELILK
ncbi:MAG: hypothetical protein OCD76_07245 [Reichenbachiella sp.]